MITPAPDAHACSAPARRAPREMPDIEAGSKNQHVYGALKAAILSGRIAPGAAIDKAAVCAELSVSRFPVAAALSRLALERLVVVAPQHGSFAAPLVLADLRECMMIRRALEGDIAALAAQEQPPGLVAVLDHVLAEATAARDDPDRFYALDVAFHDAVRASLALGQTADILDGLRARLERMRRIAAAPDGRPEAVCAEHRAIRDAIAAGEPRRARATMRRHLGRTSDLFGHIAQSHPSLFSDQPR